MNKRKNGKIEFLRFVMSISILLFHVYKYIIGESTQGRPITLFHHGSVGVEFFFLLSGLLMAQSIYNRNQREGETELKSTECIHFLKRKYISIIPYHLVAFVITFCCNVIINKYHLVKIVKYAIESIPNLFLIQMTGISLSNPNHVEWYLSVMLISMAILYPICRKYYDMFVRYIGPIIAVLILGYLMYTTERLTGVSVWMGFCYKANLRGFAEIILGATCFELAKTLSAKSLSKQKKMLLTGAEVIIFLCIIFYQIVRFTAKGEIYALAAFMLLLILVYSDVTYGEKYFRNSLVMKLGKLSLPLYLGQVAGIGLVKKYLAGYSVKGQVLACVAAAFIIAFIILGVGNRIARAISK